MSGFVIRTQRIILFVFINSLFIFLNSLFIFMNSIETNLNNNYNFAHESEFFLLNTNAHALGFAACYQRDARMATNFP